MQRSPEVVLLRWIIRPLNVGHRLKYDLQIWVKVMHAVDLFIYNWYYSVTQLKHVVLCYLAENYKGNLLTINRGNRIQLSSAGLIIVIVYFEAKDINK